VLRLLEREYGRPPPERRRALDVLIGTILSQNTSDINSHRAFESLRKAFPSWRAAAEARVSAIASAIRSGGLARTKAPRIRAILHHLLRERGKVDLEFLERLPRNQALDYLMSLPGVGPKTASCVLLFGFGKPVLPVDTHVHRVSRRLGLVNERASPEETQAALERIVPARNRHSFHINLIAHGRAVCRPRPRCRECVLLALCPYGRSVLGVRRWKR
jgi:endonuclease-3